MSNHEEQARRMFAIADNLVRAVHKKCPGFGFTVVVHEQPLRPQGCPMGVSTTLPSRTLMRVVLAEALINAALADGVETPGDTVSLVEADLTALLDPKASS